MSPKKFGVLALLILVACKGGKESSEAMQSSPPMARSIATPSLASGAATDQGAQNKIGFAEVPAAPPEPSVTQSNNGDVPTSMLIRTGAASIEVDKLDPALAKVRQLAAQLGGYVGNSSFSGGRDQVRTASLELKIPVQRYDQAIGGLGNIGKVESVNTNVEDAGEEYVDISARVANSRKLEERLVNLLATRTGKLEDVLAVERELARVREEIERYEGRMRYLRTRAAMSTLTVTVHEPEPILGHNPGDNPIVGAIKQAWRNFVGFIAWLIASLGVIIPAVLVGSVIWFGYRRFRQRG